MAQRVVVVDLDVTWEPNAPGAVLSACDDGTAILRLAPHGRDPDRRDVLLFWSGAVLARMEPPNDEARSGHRLYAAGLGDVLGVGEVIESGLIADVEQIDSVHPYHDPARFATLRHWIVPLKECTAEVGSLGRSTCTVASRHSNQRASSEPPFGLVSTTLVRWTKTAPR